MSITFIILFIFLLLALIGACYKNYQLQQREDFIINLSDELDTLLAKAREEMTKNKKLVETAADLVRTYGDPATEAAAGIGGDYGDISSPEMMATIITVLVNKQGVTRLSMKDFSDVADEEYVSVYVDTGTQELVLSLNHELDVATVDEAPALFGLSPKDDTYH